MRVAALTSVLALALAPGAGASVGTAVTVSGPSAGIVELGGVAMSQDGTGGVVWLERSDGRMHVFAARFAGGRFHPPQRVDVEQAFDSSWSAIGARDGGGLVVTWVQEAVDSAGAPADRLYSASLDPGATRFEAPVPIDFNVGESYATHPSLAMSPGGAAYIAYRVAVPPEQRPQLPAGYVESDTRLARYNGETWSSLGAPADRNSAAPVRLPTAENSPKVGIDVSGNGVVAFQEPDDEFVDRVYARRLFGLTHGNPLLVSPQAVDGQPLRGAADQFAISVAGFGQATVALRQQPGERSPLGGARIFVNQIPERFADDAAAFTTPRPADGQGGGVDPAALGPATVASTSRGGFLTGFTLGNASHAVAGDEDAVGPGETLDDGASGVPGGPVVELADSGRAVLAWRTAAGGGGVIVQERTSAGAVAGYVSAAGGRVRDLRIAGSGHGDALVAWLEGEDEAARLAAAVVDTPPAPFALASTDRWIRTPEVRLRWDAAPDALGGAAYTVVVDGVARAPQSGTRLALGPAELPDGVHEIAVSATDAAGQRTDARVQTFRVDRRAPRVRVRRRGSRVTVLISDGPRRRGSGLSPGRGAVRWGDGRTTRRVTSRAAHRFGPPGRYRIRVVTRDRAGHRVTVRRTVRVK